MEGRLDDASSRERSVVAASQREERAQRAEDRGRRGTGLVLASLVAVLMNASLVLPFFAWFLSREPSTTTGETEVRVVQRSRAKIDRARLDLDDKKMPRPLSKKAEDEKKKAEDVEPPGQVVRLAPPEKEETPDRADYASEWNQKTDRETKARDTARYAKNVTRSRSDGRDVIQETAPPVNENAQEASTGTGLPSGELSDGKAERGEEGEAERDGQPAEAPRFAFEIPRVDAKERLKLDVRDDGSVKNQQSNPGVEGQGDRARLSMGRELDELERDILDMRREAGLGAARRRGGGGDDLPTLAQLIPSLKELERVSGAPVNDHLPDVETDAETRLNAWRWKHATFFNRVADGVRRTWVGPEVLGERDPSGRLYGSDDVFTVLQVTIDREGNVVDVMVAEPSGHDFYDDEAIRSFKDSGPFANPPAALFQGGERFTFTFGFSVSYERRNVDFNWRPY